MISMPRPSKKKGAPECGLFIHIPQEEFGTVLLEKLRSVSKALNASDYEKNRHVFVYHAKDGGFTEEEVGLIGQFLQSQGMVLLVMDPTSVYDNTDGYLYVSADGIDHLSPEERESRIIGYYPDTFDRSAILDVVIKGVDIVCIPFDQTVSLESVTDLISCIKNISPTVCVIEHNDKALSLKEAMRAGVTFIDVGDVWEHKKPDAYITALLDKIENESSDTHDA